MKHFISYMVINAYVLGACILKYIQPNNIEAVNNFLLPIGFIIILLTEYETESIRRFIKELPDE